MKTLATEIRQAAKDLNWPVTVVYKKAGILSASMSQWENGTNARPETVQKVRRKLELLKVKNAADEVLPTAEGLPSSKVSEFESDSMTMKLIWIVVGEWERGGVADVDALESLRYLLK